MTQRSPAAKVTAPMADDDGPSLFTRILERESLRPDVKRAIRMTLALMLPLAAATLGPLKFSPIHLCFGAQSIAMVDVRGAYGFRFALLAAMSLILTSAVALGSLAGGGLVWILAGAVLVVGAGGLWRHLSSEHGPSMAIATGLMYFLTVAERQAGGAPPEHAIAFTLAGSFFGVLLQVAAWPVQPQHPLRKTVAESSLALADLLAAILQDGPARGPALADAETAMRAAINRTHAYLTAAARRGDLHKRLEDLNLIAARLAMRSMVLNTALEMPTSPSALPRNAFDPLLESLANLARSVATCVVSRQASHLALMEVRLTRINSLAAALQPRILTTTNGAELIEIIGHISAQLPGAANTLREITSHAEERSSVSLELSDLKALRPLAFELDPWRRPEPALVRHTIRTTCLALVGVLAMYYGRGKLPHGYWIPFTMLVVLQPDYGSTRQRAAQRMLGTLAGGLLASVLLWVHPAAWIVLLATTAATLLFGYFVKKNYGVAVVFITLMVVLLTETSRTVTLEFTLERTGSTLGGGLLALAAAALFWPVWEASRFPAIMARAVEKNSAYLTAVFQRLLDGGAADEPLTDARREAESSSIDVFSSLKRMSGDPRNRRKGLEQAASLANGNQRITRALNVIVLHLNDQKSTRPDEVRRLSELCVAGFAALARQDHSPALFTALDNLEDFHLPELPPEHEDASRFREPWVYPQLARIITELSAMLLSVSRTSEPPPGRDDSH